MRRASFNPKTDWKVEIPWTDRHGIARVFVRHGRAACTEPGTIAEEVIRVLNATSNVLVALHAEAAGQRGDVKVFHPALNAPPEA